MLGLPIVPQRLIIFSNSFIAAGNADADDEPTTGSAQILQLPRGSRREKPPRIAASQ
jgi:hypothetical protein